MQHRTNSRRSLRLDLDLDLRSESDWAQILVCEILSHISFFFFFLERHFRPLTLLSCISPLDNHVLNKEHVLFDLSQHVRPLSLSSSLNLTIA